MKKKYDKLVRDNIVDLIIKDGKTCKYKVVNNDECFLYLIKKAHEEIEELRESKSIEELADIIEVLEAIKNNLNFSNKEIDKTRNLKNHLNGKFDNKIILLEVNDAK